MTFFTANYWRITMVGISLLSVGFVGFLAMTGPTFLIALFSLVAIINIANTVFILRTPVVAIDGERVTVRVALARPAQHFLRDEVVGVAQDADWLHLLRRDAKAVRVPIRSFTKADRARLTAAFASA